MRLAEPCVDGKITQGLRPVCAQRKIPLPTSSGPITVTDATFEADFERSPFPCCFIYGAHVRTLPDHGAHTRWTEIAGRERVAKLNLDENPATAARFNARNIPTLLALKAGREINRIVGVQPKSEIAIVRWRGRRSHLDGRKKQGWHLSFASEAERHD